MTRLLPLFAVGLVLRPQIVGVGPLLPRIESSLHISHGVAGLLATIPVLCMGVFAPVAPPMLRRFGSRAAIGASLAIALAVGVLRAALPSAALVLLFTVPVGLGIAVAGTLLPVIVREEHAERPTLGTGVYTAGINVGATIASIAAAPLAVLAGWRWTLVVYSLVSLALVLPWVRRRHAAAAPPARAPLPLRDRLAWVLAGVFALQSILFYGFNAWLADAYVERGWSDTRAGGLVAVMNGVALVVGLGTALAADRAGSRRSFLLAGSGASVAAGSLIAANAGGAWAWALLLGVGIGSLFTIVMTLPLDAGRDRAEVAAYSTVMLGAGYAVSSLAPTALGAVRDATGTFTAPLSILAVDALLLLVLSAGVRVRSAVSSGAGTAPRARP